MQEITFNSTFMREMRVIAFVTQLVDDGKLAGTKRMLLHAIEGDDVIGKLSKSSTMNRDWDFLTYLHEIGRQRTDDWLRAHFDCLGMVSTIDLHSKYW
jgi:NTE family protein